MTSVCNLFDICHRYQNRWILYKANLDIHRGDFIALTGENGVGKTTILRLISTLEKPTYGSVVWSGKQPVIGIQVGDSYLYNELSVMENLQFFSNLYNLNNPQARVDELIELFQLGVMKDKLFKYLSKGYQKRVTVARALIHKPDMLLLDEPFDGLDEGSASFLQQQLLNFNRQGMTIVFVSHLKSIVNALASKVYRIENQSIVESVIEKR